MPNLESQDLVDCQSEYRLLIVNAIQNKLIIKSSINILDLYFISTLGVALLKL